jgi:hypothetical protein
MEREEAGIERPVFQQDLFSRSTWDILGLTPRQLLGLGAFTGAAIGGTIDASLGGTSFFAGAVGGALLGAASVAYFTTRRFASIYHVGKFLSGSRIVRIGPHKNRNFPWILLDRALLHLFTVRDFSHGRREKIVINNHENEGIVKGLKLNRKRELADLFNRIQRHDSGISEKEKIRLENLLLEIVSSENALQPVMPQTKRGKNNLKGA